VLLLDVDPESLRFEDDAVVFSSATGPASRCVAAPDIEHLFDYPAVTRASTPLPGTLIFSARTGSHHLSALAGAHPHLRPGPYSVRFVSAWKQRGGIVKSLRLYVLSPTSDRLICAEHVSDADDVRREPQTSNATTSRRSTKADGRVILRSRCRIPFQVLDRKHVRAEHGSQTEVDIADAPPRVEKTGNTSSSRRPDGSARSIRPFGSPPGQSLSRCFPRTRARRQGLATCCFVLLRHLLEAQNRPHSAR
jgi:hypothetical protein